MANETYERGLEIRKSVLGREFVEKSIATADDFNRPLQELAMEYCWGAVWGREGLDRKTRGLIDLARISALNRPHELTSSRSTSRARSATASRASRSARSCCRWASAATYRPPWTCPRRARGAGRVRPGQTGPGRTAWVRLFSAARP
jgi:4-carboxymuconolactone decarboxylase